MPTLPDLRVAPPRSWDEFEDIVCSAAKNRWSNPDFTRHGRQGQRQDGVDIYGSDHEGRFVGIQCKNTWAGITIKMIKDEVDKAENFQPRLACLYVATTAETDKAVQRSVREISTQRKKEGTFEVVILFWNDIWADLTRDESRLFQHYPTLRPRDSSGKREPSHDRKLFQEFQSALSFDPTIRFLRDQDFGQAFFRRSIEPLSEFSYTWDQPEKEFIDPELQAQLAALKEAAHTLNDHFAEKTVMVGDGRRISVFSDHLRGAGPKPDWVREDGRFLNKEALLFVHIYEEFIRLCKRKLET